ncbi:GSCFA domain-containing protein [Ideonella sp. YS5]|uniref:GSCFA domain-containing protein n=1 Tax=Ideonella sp. YS5 TaxID=3453714 RepID=UPI003EEBB428
MKGLLGRVLGGPTPEEPAWAPSGTRPLDRVDAAAARAAHKTNPHSTWAARAQEANQADRTLACHRIWASKPELGIRPKFRVGRDQAVFAFGSCFAREVEDALVDLGLEVPSRCDGLFSRAPLVHDEAFNPGARPRAYLNRYNSMSMLDEFRHLLGLAPELERGLLTYGLDRGSAADLHYTQSLRQANLETTMARRQAVREHLGPLLRRCKLFVLTLGMAECWFDEKAGRYLNNTPGARVLAAFGEQLAVHLTRFEQHRAALESLHQLLRSVHGDDFRVVITVSPVPLERSFLAQDVVTTNSYSKAMLRTAAQEFAAGHDNVDYFPSYELVTFADPRRAWAWDGRHVSAELVSHVMTLFRRHYVEGAATDAPGR